jgi:23S rRNA pseudouridine2605 synthase
MGASKRQAPYDAQGVRLQKLLAGAGYGSRRACEGLIEAGRVTVDGIRVRELGWRVDPATRQIHVDTMPVTLDQRAVTLALNKPLGVVSAMTDPKDRPTVADYVENRSERLFHVGRLDTDSEGLLLLTNEGELANRLTHPSHEVPKTYVATVEGRLTGTTQRALKEGVELKDGIQAVDSLRILDSSMGLTMVEVVLHSGRNRVVRRLFKEVGTPVTRLVRTRIGPIALGDLKPGRTRVLGRVELASLKKAVGL